jgi:Protein of unknown function (DUF1236)
MRPIATVAFGLAFLSGATAAQGQTTMTRQITTEPVETVITQGPAGTEVTRRVLNPAPPAYINPAPGYYGNPAPAYYGAPGYVAPSAGYVEPVEDAYVETVPTVTRRVTTSRTRTIERPTTTGQASRTVVHRTVRSVRAAPLALSPAQRQIIYRTIVQREVYPAPAAVPVAPPVVAQTEVVAPVDTGYYGYRDYRSSDDYYYRDRYANGYYRDYPYRDYAYRDYDYGYSAPPVAVAPAPVAASYVVGARIPASVPLVAVPDTVAARIPAVAPYSYAVIGTRVYLVDPATNLIVADITR